MLKFDSKSQVAVYKDVYKYTMEKALYHEAEKKLFGCEFLISGNGEKRRVLVYVDPSCFKTGSAMELGIWAISVCEKNKWKVSPAMVCEILAKQEEKLTAEAND